MFAALKKLFSRGASTSETAPVPPPQTSAPSQRMASPAARLVTPPVPPHMRPPAPSPQAASPPVMHEAPSRPTSPSTGYGGYKFAPVPPAVPGAALTLPPAAQSTVAPECAAPMPAVGAGEVVNLPLPELLKALPEALRVGVLRHPPSDALISLPLALILPQVATGIVKVPFGLIRIACPEGMFLNSSAHDQSVVTLPLALILPRINPAYLTRRSGQRRAVDPGAFEAVFARTGQAEPSLPGAPVAPIAAQARPSEPPVAPAAQPQIANPFTPIAPSVPGPIPMSMPLPFAKAAPMPYAAPPPPLRPPAPVSAAPATRLPGTMPRTTAAPPASSQTVIGENLVIPMNLLAPHWPEPIQMVLVNPVFGAGQIGIPVAELEAGLKHGKLVFPWSRLRAWIQPTPPAGEIAEDLLVPLPLQMIVPLFLAKRSAGMAGPQKRVVLDENIPDVFSASSGGRVALATPAPITSAPALPVAPQSRQQNVAQTPIELQAVEPTEVPAMQDVGAFFGQPGKKSWTPVEIVVKTANMPGIIGAIISLQDGLLVSGQVPAGINAETVAAFLPQVFGRLAHYTRELKFGEPSYAGLVLEEYSLHIYKTGNVYFLAMGRAGEQAPLAQLALIAAQLERQSKPI